MTYLKVLRHGIFMPQKPLSAPGQGLLRALTSLELTEEQLNNAPQKKLLKVAIVGRPNAGKSTIINSILKMNLCGVSCKTHTTRSPFRAAFTKGDTQIVFIDTPGLVTHNECVRFNLSGVFTKWKNEILNEADVVGIVHEVSNPSNIFRFHINLSQNVADFPDSKPLFLILNKIDLVLDKDALSAAVESCFNPKNLEKPDGEKLPKIWRKFSRIFFTSALRDTGVQEVVDYLVELAKPNKWIFEADHVFDYPLHALITDLIRCRFLDELPQEVPFQCEYEVEYLKENSLGEIHCVGLVTCKKSRHYHMITAGKKSSLRNMTKQIECDLYKILGKIVKLRLVVNFIK